MQYSELNISVNPVSLTLLHFNKFNSFKLHKHEELAKDFNTSSVIFSKNSFFKLKKIILSFFKKIKKLSFLFDLLKFYE